MALRLSGSVRVSSTTPSSRRSTLRGPGTGSLLGSTGPRSRGGPRLTARAVRGQRPDGAPARLRGGAVTVSVRGYAAARNARAPTRPRTCWGTAPSTRLEDPVAESYNGYCVKCKEKRDFDGEVKVSESGAGWPRACARSAAPR